jgi:hypothetical protein
MLQHPAADPQFTATTSHKEAVQLESQIPEPFLGILLILLSGVGAVPTNVYFWVYGYHVLGKDVVLPLVYKRQVIPVNGGPPSIL